MRELLPDINLYLAEGKEVAIATVVKAYGSAPRQPGSKMIVSSSGDMAGSVSGGCVEGAVFEEAQKVLKAGRPKLVEYGIADELAFEVVGLACGGNIQVFIEALPQIYQTLQSSLLNGELLALATGVDGAALGKKLLLWPDGRTQGGLGALALEKSVGNYAADLLSAQRSERKVFETAAGRADIFIEVYPPPKRLIIVGAVHIAIPLVTFARELGFRTIVVDARAAFASARRFSHADDLILRWPAEALADLDLDQGSYLVFLSHDEKLDNPALKVALQTQARYIGALGARKTHAHRLESLRAMGLTNAQLSRIHAPIGLDLGGRTPEEVAVSIIAEIVAVRHSRA
ncbi:MAG TPA: XshC-Cox1 family protein [Chloroflexi bacterium]|nr:MAG: hypothetical protein B6243_11145 [Anaerolineaceae bacterium 4572_5.2]HEY84621.1 XshC-Cox1 family protein [Chloroflexota bacterium]